MSLSNDYLILYVHLLFDSIHLSTTAKKKNPEC